MDMHVEKIISGFIFVLGVSLFLQPKFWISYAKDLIQHPHQLIPLGMLTLLIGLCVVCLHPQTQGMPAMLTTILGWVMLLKGALILYFPMQMMRLYPTKILSKPVLMIDGVLMVALALYIYWPQLS